MHRPRRVAVATLVALAALPAAVAHAGYPQQNVLPVWPDNPNDASIAIGVTPYDEIAPKLNALQAASNRVSARVAGEVVRRLRPLRRDRDRAGVATPRRGAAGRPGSQLHRGRPGARRGATAELLAALQDAAVRQRQHPRQRVGGHRRGAAGHRRVRDEHRPGRRAAAAAQPARVQHHVEPGRPRRRDARQRRGLRPQPRPDDRLAAGDAADPRPDRRRPADHHARPARLRQPDAAAPEHAAAQRQQRVRPLHPARRCRTR